MGVYCKDACKPKGDKEPSLQLHCWVHENVARAISRHHVALIIQSAIPHQWLSLWLISSDPALFLFFFSSYPTVDWLPYFLCLPHGSCLIMVPTNSWLLLAAFSVSLSNSTPIHSFDIVSLPHIRSLKGRKYDWSSHHRSRVRPVHSLASLWSRYSCLAWQVMSPWHELVLATCKELLRRDCGATDNLRLWISECPL